MPVIAGDKVTLWKAAARWKDLVYVAVTLDHLVADGVSDFDIPVERPGPMVWCGGGGSGPPPPFVSSPSRRNAWSRSPKMVKCTPTSAVRRHRRS